MKMLGPLVLDDLNAANERTQDQERDLRQELDRIAKIQVFGPACGFGNLLIVAYRTLREQDIGILTRLAELTGGALTEMWSVVPIRYLFVINLVDFEVETQPCQEAVLALRLIQRLHYTDSPIQYRKSVCGAPWFRGTLTVLITLCCDGAV